MTPEPFGPHQRPERICGGVDGSLSSRAAVRGAVAPARAEDEIVLVHAWCPAPVEPYDGSPPRDGGADAEHLARHEFRHAEALQRDPRVALSYRVVTGDAAERLAAEDADLLVVGTGSRGRLARRVSGSVSTHVCRHSSVPVVVVPAGGATQVAPGRGQPPRRNQIARDPGRTT